VRFYRKIHVMATVLSLMLACGCAHSRKTSSGLAMPQSPFRGKAELSEKRDAARRTEDKVNDVVKRLERMPGRLQRPAEAGDRPVAQMGTGTERSASTTGIVPGSSLSGASSSVVVTQPNAASDRRSNTAPGPATGSTVSPPKPTGDTVVGSVLLAGCLIAAIVWLPRRLNGR
jgi:hypothetical protein